MDKPSFYSVADALSLLHKAEKKKEAEAIYKGYGKDAKVFSARVVRGDTDISIYIDNKLVKTGLTEAEILEVLSKTAEDI